MDKQIKEINEEIKKAIQRIKNIWKKYDELREKYKAKEQECEEWKHQAELGVDTTDRLTKELEEKDQECEELKEILNEGCLHNLTLMTEQRVLLQTLAEIKEIAESEMDSKEFMTVQYMLNGSVDNKNKVLKQILQKINEVENAL